MLSLGQKLVALTVIVLLNAFVFVLSPLFGILAILASLPFTIAIFAR